MSDFKVNVDLQDVEIDVKKVIDNDMTPEDTKQLLFEVFDGLNKDDKIELVCDFFRDIEERYQNDVLDDIIANQLSDEQFHVLTNYFKKYGK